MANKSIQAQLSVRFKDILSKDDLKEIAVAGLEASRKHTTQVTRQGRDPNENGSTYTPYSESYSKRKKGGRRSPVDLRDEKNSIEKRRINKNKGTLEFRSSERGKVFAVHQEGRRTKAGQVVRKIYPENEQEVPKPVNDAIVKRTQDIIIKNLKNG